MHFLVWALPGFKTKIRVIGLTILNLNNCVFVWCVICDVWCKVCCVRHVIWRHYETPPTIRFLKFWNIEWYAFQKLCPSYPSIDSMWGGGVKWNYFYSHKNPLVQLLTLWHIVVIYIYNGCYLVRSWYKWVFLVWMDSTNNTKNTVFCPFLYNWVFVYKIIILCEDLYFYAKHNLSLNYGHLDSLMGAQKAQICSTWCAQ